MGTLSAGKQRRARQKTQKRQRELLIRAGVFGSIVVAVLAGAAYFLLPLFSPKESGIIARGESKVVNIQAAMDGFDIYEIRGKVGDTITVNLRSLDNKYHTDGGGKHQFAIDELGVNIIAEPLSVSSGTFTVTQAGVYPFYCDICCGGRANPSMNGKLIVEA